MRFLKKRFFFFTYGTNLKENRSPIIVHVSRWNDGRVCKGDVRVILVRPKCDDCRFSSDERSEFVQRGIIVAVIPHDEENEFDATAC